jgi:hypothetical protein
MHPLPAERCGDNTPIPSLEANVALAATWLPGAGPTARARHMPDPGADEGGRAHEAREVSRRKHSPAVTLLLLALVAPLAVLAHHAYRQESANRVAMEDVVAAGRALQGLEGASAIDMTIAGPGSAPALRGTLVSAGTTLFVRRWPDGTVYVRGANSDGDGIYFYWNGEIYVAPKEPPAAIGGQHG